MPQLSLFPEGALPLPRAIPPMRPAWLREPFDSPDYAFEPLYDGQRALAFLEGGRLRLQSEHLRDLTALWPELHALPDRVCADGVVLDGEVVLADGDGRPRPDLLAARLAGLPAEDAAVRYVARDLLYAGGRPLMGLPWEERRRLLEEVLAPGGPLEAAPSLPGRGVTLFEVARAGGLPGVAARGRWSPYRPGARGAGWAVIRVAPAGEFVIGGYGPSGGRSRPPAWLLLGLYRDGRLVPAGRVAGPFRPDVARTLRARLAAVRAPASPFAGSWAAPGPVRWCRPELVCRVRFAGWTAEGLVRFPLFEGLRPDVPPRACTPQDLPPGP
ncbi:MAG TPA: hypothetical protein VIO14_06940 [Dehalococcoidia bacterium]